MSENPQVNRAAIKLIHADGFYKEQEATSCFHVVRNLQYVEREYGLEIPDFQLIFPNLEPVFSRMLGEEVQIDQEKSGVFRKPIRCIHFESFENLNEWCFVIALQPTTFNIYYHLKPGGGYREFDAKTALDGHRFNYLNYFEWDYVTNILLESNQGIFFRPWIFHSMEDGIIQYFKLLPKK